MKIYSQSCQKWHEAGNIHAPPADMQIITSDGHRIAAHSSVLASASSVLENLVFMPRKNWNPERVISILGVHSEVVFALLQFIYSSRCALSSKEGKEIIEKHGVQLLVLSHKYRIDWLKRVCEIEIGKQLKANYVVDVLQIAKLCDASRLYQMCLSFLSKDFCLVENTDGWRFVQKNDPRLELEILIFLQEVDQRNKRWKKKKKEQGTYEQLSIAMDCLEHICTEGCTRVRPHDKVTPNNATTPCTEFPTCEGLQLLIRHFAACSKKASTGGTCLQCKRMWQLFRLHSSLCDHSECCRVPLCKQFKSNIETERRGDDATWRLLVKRVALARVMCSFPTRKRPELCNVFIKKQGRI